MDIRIDTTEKHYLLALARQVLEVAAKEKRALKKDEIPPLPSAQGALLENMGAFVTYHLEQELRGEAQRQLRGCIGLMQVDFPLWQSVLKMAYSAACEDHRFGPITEEELPFIHHEITILGPIFPSKKEDIILGKHGIILQAHHRRAVFLPHVPIEQGWDMHTTLVHLCRKAGLPKNTWQDDNTEFFCFEGLIIQ